MHKVCQVVIKKTNNNIALDLLYFIKNKTNAKCGSVILALTLLEKLTLFFLTGTHLDNITCKFKPETERVDTSRPTN